MARGISLVGVNSAGGIITGGGQDYHTVSGALTAVKGDGVASHGKSPHSSPVMAEGHDWYTINDIPVVVAGHSATCGHAANGQDWYTVG